MKKMTENIFRYLTIALLAVFSISIANAYESIIIKFPDQGWHIVYTQYGKAESILQYAPSGQTHDDFT